MQAEGCVADITDRDVHYYSSGTMALAAAVKLAIRRRTVKHPRVIVPGYGCPDLVAAVRFAGAEAEYVDIAPHSTNMQKELVEAAFDRAGSNTVALVGVDLFGLPEEWSALLNIAERNNALAIQDCAQSVQSAHLYPKELVGHVVVFSFGRGKPVCCLSGGAMLSQPDIGDAITSRRSRRESVMGLLIRNTMYNLLLRPRPYAIVARLMGDRLGTTRYVPLERIESPGPSVSRVFDNSVMKYFAEHRDSVRNVFESLDEIVRENSAVLRWPANLNDTMCSRRLSRLPLLVTQADLRDRLESELVSNGISATRMYKRSLPQIVAEHDGQEPDHKMSNAEDFAAQLLTLPVHERIRQKDIENMRKVVENAVSGL